ncbi:hypothetical protein N181_23245 [Sinorhizobium fredii USDA 205]|nr:hypothetical protein N181_23245 [Sinorhizobium fredii USDA 205]
MSYSDPRSTQSIARVALRTARPLREALDVDGCVHEILLDFVEESRVSAAREAS